MEQVTRRLEVLSTPDNDETCCTFVLKNEDHTLGNALRYVISKNPQVEYCGYSLPHPSICEINFRIQTYGVPAVEVLKKGLEDLLSLCDHIKSTFDDALNEYKGIKTDKGDDIERMLAEMDA
ncbi:DNA-directed RNA polymerases I and III subunit RPAC2-like [Stegodyphus dumicola]|uniref:DNA-directed RNA polymerases I and III subunit RPAC2-like n=1 Tax=Stegodyphus dumicola TaxID=202533 RepID=UPI0015B1A77A|nr:DNA-directed RNA polymerases I and III subunit RPAC2-like [Stegodyphus dumicola]